MIKRYDVTEEGGIARATEREDGKYVRYEDHAAYVTRIQNHCRHDGGRSFIGGKSNICTICSWDMDKCQHRGERGNFCSQCGEALK